MRRRRSKGKKKRKRRFSDAKEGLAMADTSSN